MGTVNLIYDYFPELTEEQRERFARLEGLYREWNETVSYTHLTLPTKA